jgi:predicted metal-dependent peptidase
MEEVGKVEEQISPNAEEIEKVRDAFVTDRMKFVALMPFYGILLLDLDAVATGIEIPIAAVNYKNLYLHALSDARRPKGKDKETGEDCPTGYAYNDLSIAARRTVLAHEIGHLIFEHLSIPREFDKNISNVAMDAVINRILAQDSTFNLNELPDGCVLPIRDHYGKFTGFSIGPGKSKKTYIIPDYDKKDWVPIYWDIYNQMEKEACQALGLSAGSKGASAEQRKKIAEAIKKAAEQMGKNNPMNGDAGKGNDEEQGAEFDQAKAKFRQKVVAAVEQCKSQGNLPGEFVRLVQELEDGKVHWTTYLRRLLKTEISRDDFCHKANSRRAHINFGGSRRPPIFPKVETEALGDVFLALDTSGSMSEKDIREGLSEFASLRQAVPFRLHFLSCDAQAYQVTTYDRFEEPDWLDMPIHGGGGTDFRPVFKLIEEYREEKGVRPALLVYFTDTMGSFPEEEPNYSVIWVCNYRTGKVPWGHFVSTVD